MVFPVAAMMAMAAIGIASEASGQVAPRLRARKFLELTARADIKGKALAFDVLDPPDDPVILDAAFRVLKAEHPLLHMAGAKFLAKITGEETLARFVKKGLGNRDAVIRMTCAAAMEDPGAPESLCPELVPLLEDRDWRVRAAAAEALGARRRKEELPAVAVLTADQDPRVRVAALRVLTRAQQLAHVDRIIAALPDDTWTVRSTALEAVRELRPRKAFEPLIDRLVKETGRLRTQAHRVMVSMAGRDFGLDPELWRNWYGGQAKRHGQEGRMIPEGSPYSGRPQKTVTRRFFDIETEARRIVFVLDASGSMLAEARRLRVAPESAPAGPPTRYQIILEEVAMTLSNFEDKDAFNIVLFGSDVKTWKESLQPATPANRQSALSFLRSMKPSGETNLFEGIARGLGVSAKGARTGKGYFDEVAGGKTGQDIGPGPEAVFLLSDGVPTCGAITDGDIIAEEIRRVNRWRRLIIHTIAVGKFHAYYLGRIARENGGRTVQVGE